MSNLSNYEAQSTAPEAPATQVDLPLPIRAPEEPLIAPGARFEGTLSFHGAARIDGEFKGSLLGQGRLVLGPAAQVDADVDVDELVVAGQLHGRIRARARVILESTSQVDAAIEAGALEIRPGASLNGRCKAGSSPEVPDPKGERAAGSG